MSSSSTGGSVDPGEAAHALGRRTVALVCRVAATQRWIALKSSSERARTRGLLTEVDVISFVVAS
jgi:hypothetical protein